MLEYWSYGMLEIDANMMFTFSASGDTPILRCIVSGLQNIGFWPLVIIPVFHHSCIPWDDIDLPLLKVHGLVASRDVAVLADRFPHVLSNEWGPLIFAAKSGFSGYKRTVNDYGNDNGRRLDFLLS